MTTLPARSYSVATPFCRHTLALFIMLLTVAGCMGRIKTEVADGTDTTDQVAGFEGRALLGTTCGNAAEGETCQDKPISTTFEVLDEDGLRLTTFESDADGYFHVEIDPGTYIIVPLKSIPLPNRPRQRNGVTVEAGQVTYVNLVLETGIQ